MANSQAADGERRTRRRHRSSSELEDVKVCPMSGKKTVAQDPSHEKVSSTGVERIESRSKRNNISEATSNMTSVSHATIPSSRSGSTHRRRRRRHRSADTEHRRRSKEKSGHISRSSAERTRSSRLSVPSKTKVDNDASDSERSSTEEELVEVKPRKKTKIIYITEEESVLGRHKERKVTTDREVRSPSKASERSTLRSRASHSRRKSTADISLPSPPKRCI